MLADLKWEHILNSNNTQKKLLLHGKPELIIRLRASGPHKSTCVLVLSLTRTPMMSDQ